MKASYKTKIRKIISVDFLVMSSTENTLGDAPLNTPIAECLTYCLDVTSWLFPSSKARAVSVLSSLGAIININWGVIQHSAARNRRIAHPLKYPQS